jgi:hypothetical protein
MQPHQQAKHGSHADPERAQVRQQRPAKVLGA